MGSSASSRRGLPARAQARARVGRARRPSRAARRGRGRGARAGTRRDRARARVEQADLRRLERGLGVPAHAEGGRQRPGGRRRGLSFVRDRRPRRRGLSAFSYVRKKSTGTPGDAPRGWPPAAPATPAAAGLPDARLTSPGAPCMKMARSRPAVPSAPSPRRPRGPSGPCRRRRRSRPPAARRPPAPSPPPPRRRRRRARPAATGSPLAARCGRRAARAPRRAGRARRRGRGRRGRAGGGVGVAGGGGVGVAAGLCFEVERLAARHLVSLPQSASWP